MKIVNSLKMYRKIILFNRKQKKLQKHGNVNKHAALLIMIRFAPFCNQ